MTEIRSRGLTGTTANQIIGQVVNIGLKWNSTRVLEHLDGTIFSLLQFQLGEYIWEKTKSMKTKLYVHLSFPKIAKKFQNILFTMIYFDKIIFKI